MENLAGFMMMAFKSRSELDDIFDAGMFNATLRGYLILSMRAAGQNEAEIELTLRALDKMLDSVAAAEARDVWEKSAF
jgi:hypothetical protein